MFGNRQIRTFLEYYHKILNLLNSIQRWSSKSLITPISSLCKTFNLSLRRFNKTVQSRFFKHPSNEFRLNFNVRLLSFRLHAIHPDENIRFVHPYCDSACFRFRLYSIQFELLKDIGQSQFQINKLLSVS